ncbi:vomeronasal type-2 receptor 26-like [Lithobates pipiens]
MTRKCKDDRGPKKRTSFFPPPLHGGRQDGAGLSTDRGACSASSPYTDMPDAIPLPTDGAERHSPPLGEEDPPSPSCCSPVKTRQKLDYTSSEVSQNPTAFLGPDRPELSSIAAFPTANQLILDTQLKEILMTLHNSLHNDLCTLTKQFSREFHALGDRVNNIEQSMGDMTSTINELVDAHDENVEDKVWIKAKMADLEDRSRRNNLKIRGTNKTRGVLNAIHCSVDFKLQEFISDINGRYLILTCTIDFVPLTIATVYAPNRKQLSFLNNTMRKIRKVQKGSLVLSGDFNIIHDPELDTSNPKTRNHLTMGPFLLKNDLYDTWRCLYPDDREYSYHSPVHNTYTRIDYIFTDKWLLQRVAESDIAPITWVDHAPISTTLHIVKSQPTHKVWRVNVQLLQIPTSADTLRQQMAEFFANNVGSVSDSATLWGAHKTFCRGILIQLNAQARKRRTQQLDTLTADIKALDALNQLRPTPQLKQKLLTLRQELRAVLLDVYEKQYHKLKARYYHTNVIFSKYHFLRPIPPYYRYFLTMLFAINEINKDPTILPNMTLGFHMYDSCNDNRKAVKSILQILSGPGQTVPNYSCRKSGKLIGFIGDQNSETTVNIAQILALYRYTQVSYGATTSVLNDRNMYPTFLRTVQSNRTIYFILSNLLQFFGWTWVGILSSDDDSGNEETQLLTQNLTMKGICVAYMIKIKPGVMSITENTFKNSIETIRMSSAQVIILCGTFSSFMADLLKEVRHMLYDKTFIFGPKIASNAFLMEHFREMLTGSLAVEFYNLPVPDMKSFYDSFQVVNHPQDMLLEHIWLLYLHCSGTNESSNRFYSKVYKVSLFNCSGTKRVTEFISFQNPGLTDRVYKAVYSLVHALHNMYLSIGSQAPEKIAQLYYWVKNQRTSKGDLLFKENGELVTLFRIMNWRSLNKSYGNQRQVGKTLTTNRSQKNFFIMVENIIWKSGINKIPKSQCSENCLPGTRKVPRSGIHACCYDCVRCSEGDISNVSDSENCQQCSYNEWPNETKDRCVQKRLDFLSYSNDHLGLVFALFSSILCAITGLILLVFILHRDTAIVKANNRNLSFTLLVSIMLSFLCVFFFLGRPADISCLLRQISFGILFTIAISCVLAKTIIVCVAFKTIKPGNLWQHLFRTKFSNVIAIICSFIQIIICVIWLSVSPPFQDLDTSSYQDKIIVQCNEGSVIGFYSVLGYMGFLAAVSFVLAFMVRTLPDSFNEAKYITFSMLVFCSVWIAMIPAYLSTRGKYLVAVEIFAILSSSSGVLGCIFFPKCYIILWRPELNTKTSIMERRIFK